MINLFPKIKKNLSTTIVFGCVNVCIHTLSKWESERFTQEKELTHGFYHFQLAWKPLLTGPKGFPVLFSSFMAEFLFPSQNSPLDFFVNHNID